MLRIDTVRVEHESFVIQQMSAYRVLSMEKKARTAQNDNDAMLSLVIDTLLRCVLVSEDNPVPRFKTEEDMDSISLPQMIKLKEAIVDFSQQPVDGGSLQAAVEDQVKN